MKNLLELALEAHGGLTRWSQLKAVTADLSVTGALWQIKGQAGALQQIRIEAELHRQKLTTHFHGRDKRTTFMPDSVTLQTEDGPQNWGQVLQSHIVVVQDATPIISSSCYSK